MTTTAVPTQAIVAILKADSRFWLLLGKDEGQYVIHGWDNIAAAVDYFEGAYNANHARGFEASMSACINHLQFAPAIVVFDDLQDLERKLLPSSTPRVAKHLSSVSGGYDVIPLETHVAEPIWRAGRHPFLIS
jgi:hypothetical protein